MLTYLDGISVDDIELGRLVLFGLFIIANVGVIVGVFLEREEYSDATKDRGWRLLVVSLGIEALLSTAVFGIDSEVSRRQKFDLAVLHGRAAKAELALAKMNADRVLTESQISDLVKTLSQYAGSTYWAIPEKGPQDEDSEQERLTNQIIRAFTAAGWKKENHWSILDQTKLEPEVLAISNRGCDIAFAAEPKSAALGSLVAASLKSAGIECRTFAGPEVIPNHVSIQVGLR